MNKELLVLFAKEPVCGQVKTRLGKDTGMKAASSLYDLLLRHIIKNVAFLKDYKDYDVIIYKTPGSSKVYFEKIADGIIVKDQPEGDLGKKMYAAFNQGFANDYERICIAGTDCPGISHADILKAFKLLKTGKLVLGPSDDGGYYLIGLSGSYPQLFENIAWSTKDVLSSTLKIAGSLGITCNLLSLKTDIDEMADIERYMSKYPDSKLTLAFKKVLIDFVVKVIT
ncbi:TIGR04282 family arsenosugar biosynthesis glycosyltransferase [Desulfobacterium sp. N47]